MDQPRYFRTLGHEQVTWTKLMVCVEKIYIFLVAVCGWDIMGKKPGKKGGCHWRWDGCRARERNLVISRQFWQHCLLLALIQSFRKSNLQHQALHWNAIMHCNRQSQGTLTVLLAFCSHSKFYANPVFNIPAKQCMLQCLALSKFKAILTETLAFCTESQSKF